MDKNIINKAFSKMIISVSGWRSVFADSDNEEDKTSKITKENSILVFVAAQAFSDYILTKQKTPDVVLGNDTRPTGVAIASIFNYVMQSKGINVHYTGIIAAPEIMAYAKNFTGFVYISASHNPVGHNGIKFGLSDGGVLSGSESAILSSDYKERCTHDDILENAEKMLSQIIEVKTNQTEKQNALKFYTDFTRQVVSASDKSNEQEKFFDELRNRKTCKNLKILADMNGSARTLSIDKQFLSTCGIELLTINDKPGQIAHAIIPEPENLVYCAKELERLQQSGNKDVLLGYMPDCDGDRGNIVYWNEKNNKAEILMAQEVFALSVMAELAFMRLKTPDARLAVAVNDPTSMRIEEIAKAFDAEVFRAEVGEANVVNLARRLRDEGYIVRILGEGSNGGNITYPASVRDPLNTIFSIIKLLTIPELFKLWCDKSDNKNAYIENPTLADIQKTLPVYTTTGVSEKRAVLHIHTTDHGSLKSAYQSVLDLQWQNVSADFNLKYGITSFVPISNNGINETKNIKNFCDSAKGGLKLVFLDAGKNPIAFVWMRGSGTEPVFRVMCDVKGNKPEMEADLLEWHTRLIEAADSIA